MSINSSNTREFDIDRIVLRGLQVAGLLPPGQAQSGTQWEQQSSLARDMLEMELDNLQAGCPIHRKVELYDLALTASAATAALPSGSIGIHGAGMFAATGETSETRVEQIDARAYHGLSVKTTEGRPTMMWLEKLSSLTLYLYPVPSENGTLSIRLEKLTADFDDGQNTPDLHSYWSKFLIYMVAHHMASAAGLPLQERDYFRAVAEEAKQKAERRQGSNVAGWVRSIHRGGCR